MTKSYIPLPKKLAFTPHDLILLHNKNLGLRLTDNLEQHINGGRGDAIPLSQLAGAIDIIRFVGLALQYKNKQVQETYASLIEIYEIYSSTDQIEDTCLPNLLLSYGAKCGIPDAINKVNQENRVFLPKNEEELLLDMHHRLEDSLANIVESLPVFSQLLANNFNEKLAERLHLNYEAFATSYDMDYLLLCDETQPDLFKTGYDLNHYPMGKVGARVFESKDILEEIMFLAGETKSLEQEKNLLYRIVNRIKFRIQGTNYQYYNGDDEDTTEDNISFFGRHSLAISLSAGAGLSAGIGLGLAMGVFNAIPTGGASILATPFAVLILGAVGFVIGLVAGIIGSLVVDNWSTSEPDDPSPITPSVENISFFSSSEQTSRNSYEENRQLIMECY